MKVESTLHIEGICIAKKTLRGEMLQRRMRPDRLPGRSRNKLSCLGEIWTNWVLQNGHSLAYWAARRLCSALQVLSSVSCHSCWAGLCGCICLCTISSVSNPSPIFVWVTPIKLHQIGLQWYHTFLCYGFPIWGEQTSVLHLPRKKLPCNSYTSF